MARSPATGEGSVIEQTTLIFPKKSELEELLSTKRQSKKRSQSASGTYSKALSSSIEHANVSRFAFQHAAAFADLDDEKLHVEMFHFIDYVKKLGVLKRAMAQEEMFDENKTDDAALSPGRAVRRSKAQKEADAAAEAAGGGGRGTGLKLVGDAVRTVAEAAGADK